MNFSHHLRINFQLSVSALLFAALIGAPDLLMAEELPRFVDGDSLFNTFVLPNSSKLLDQPAPIEERVIQIVQQNFVYALTADSNVWVWGQDISDHPKLIFSHAQKLSAVSSSGGYQPIRVVHQDGSMWTLKQQNGYRWDWSSWAKIAYTDTSACEMPCQSLTNNPTGGTESKLKSVEQDVSHYKERIDNFMAGSVVLKKDGKLVGLGDTQVERSKAKPTNENLLADNVSWFSYWYVGKKDGSLWRWVSVNKSITDKKLALVEGPPRFIVKAQPTGYSGAFGITQNGELWHWHENEPNDITQSVIKAVAQKLSTDTIEIHQLRKQLFVLKKDGGLWLWQGDNQLAFVANDIAYFDGRFLLKSDTSLWQVDYGIKPKLSQIADRVVSIYRANLSSNSASEFIHIIKADGSLWAWGTNANGELGTGWRGYYSTPIQILSGVKFAAVSALNGYAIKQDGSLWAWGNNKLGIIGEKAIVSPTRIETDFSAVAAVHDSVFGIKPDGSLWAWGGNQFGQLGDGTTINQRHPVKIGTGFRAVTAGYSYTVYGIKKDDSLWQWGGSAETEFMAAPPQQIGTGYQSLAPGCTHWLALKKDHSLWAWGANFSGQLGDGSRKDKTKPVRVLTQVAQADAGGASVSAAVKLDGTLWAWGGMDSVLKPKLMGRDYVRVLVQGEDIYAINKNTEIWRFYKDERAGYHSEKQWQRFSMDAGYAELIKTRGGECEWSSGHGPAFALKKDGSLWGWGPASGGQLGHGDKLSSQQAMRVRFTKDESAP